MQATKQYTPPRELTLPADFADALEAEPQALDSYARLSYDQQRWFVLGIEGGKAPATRQRRVAQAVARLRQGRSNR